MNEPIRAWHFLREDMTSPNAPRTKWTVGQSRTLRGGDIVPCQRGYHGSPTTWDCLQYFTGPVLCRVELSGDVTPHGDPVDKYAARTRKLLAARDAAARAAYTARAAATCAAEREWQRERWAFHFAPIEQEMVR